MDIDKNGKMDWFFAEWVYGTQVPSYKLEYQVGQGGSFSAKITQSGVNNDFVMIVPLYLDFGKGWIKLGTVTLAGNTTFELKDIKLPASPKSAALCAMNDVLAVSIQNSK